MAFTARRVRSAISLVTALLSWNACQLADQRAPLPLVRIDSAHIENRDGVLYADAARFTGILYALTTARDTIFKRSYVNGLEHGTHKLWYPNTRLQEIRRYADGKKTGINQGFWPDGSRRYLYRFERDVYVGTQYEWYENHQLYSKKNYRAGYEGGLQRSWNPDGSARSNYEARNGRNYGNIGRKNCFSTWKNAAFTSAH